MMDCNPSLSWLQKVGPLSLRFYVCTNLLPIPFTDLIDIHSRLFNHRPFVRGETKHFVKEFETRRKDREVDRVFKVLERVTDLRDCEVDKLRAQCDSVVPNVNANLLVAQSMCNKILDQSRSTEIVRKQSIIFNQILLPITRFVSQDQALESSRLAREKEWSNFMTDIQDKCTRIDDAYNQQEADLRKQFEEMEKQLGKN